MSTSELQFSDRETARLLSATVTVRGGDISSQPAARVLRFMAGHTSGRDRRLLFEPTTIWLLNLIAHWSVRSKDAPTVRLAAERVLGEKIGCGVSRIVVRRRLHLMARYGILRVVAEWDGTCRRYKTGAIEVHPALDLGLSGKASLKDKDICAFAAYYAPLGVARADSDVDLQGFETDCVYGQTEQGAPARRTGSPADASPPSGEAAAAATAAKAKDAWEATRIDAKAAAKEQRARDRFEQSKLERVFVDGCARVWAACQSQVHGRPDVEPPAWSGDMAVLGPTGKRQFQELAAIFRTQGGKRAALAWYIFCASSPSTDAKGKLLFDPKRAYVQWASLDKQPSAFAKYFNSVTLEFPAYAAEAAIGEILTAFYAPDVLARTPAAQPNAFKLPQQPRLASEGGAPR